MKRNVLKVFLASPSDLKDERKIVKDVVERVNIVVGRRVDWHIELFGWEDTLPAYSRPQSLINKDVDSCDLFLGMLWQRWGEPTGEFSSGFEEEFMRACKRRKVTNSPEIWLFFKNIEEDRLKDPGEQLSKVVNFKKEQEEIKELLFKGFKDSLEWEKLIHDSLLGYLLELSHSEESVLIERSPILEAGREEPEELAGGKGYPSQIKSLFSKVLDRVAKKSANDLDFWERTRLFILTSAWFSDVHIGEILGNHEINLAYRIRKDWRLSGEEKRLIFRSIITGIDSNVGPGWFWFRDWETESFDNILCYLASEDNNTDVRRSAISILTESKFKANKDFLSKGINDDNNDIVLEFIKLLCASESLENIDLLSPLISSSEQSLREAAISAKFEIMYIHKPNKAFQELIKNGKIIPKLIQDAVTNVNLKVDDDILISAIRQADTPIRKLSAQYLLNTNRLTKEICYELIKDTSLVVRKYGLIGLINLGERLDIDYIKKILPEKEATTSGPALTGFGLSGILGPETVSYREIIPLFLRKQKPDELLSLFDFYGAYSDDAYRILAEDHFDFVEARIRLDLDSKFDYLKQESDNKLRIKYGDAADTVIEDWKKLVDFTRDSHIAAALAGLVKHGKPDDIKYARIFIGSTLYKLADKESIILMAKFGDSTDSEKLLSYAKSTYGDLKKIAVEPALKLSPGLSNVLKECLLSNDYEIIKVAAKELISIDKPNSIQLSKDLLENEKDDIRLLGVAVLVKICTNEQLEEILDEYLSRKSYYYNVVTSLDRCLYASGRYGVYFKEKLLSLIESGKGIKPRRIRRRGRKVLRK